MTAKKFGYVRVSTREQNPERQIHILRDEEGIDERDIYVEKESGRQFAWRSWGTGRPPSAGS